MFEIKLRDSLGKDFIFPVSPEEINISRGKGFETVNILSLGEFDFSNGEKVKEITFSSFFPSVYNDSYCKKNENNEIPDPRDAMFRLTEMMNSKIPYQLIIAGSTGKVINAYVLISAHNSTFRGGEPGDIYFDFTARTWRKPKIHTQAGKNAGSSSTSRADMKSKSKTYTVKSGDTLSKIAKLELGSSTKWKDIYNLNKAAIGSDPNLIRAGQRLVLPS
ncbi:LysM domain/BON superfamily protein [compost metagenome]